MKKEEYVAAINQIAPKETVKEEIRENLFNTPVSTQRKPTFRWSMAAAALAIICIGTGGSIRNPFIYLKQIPIVFADYRCD